MAEKITKPQRKLLERVVATNGGGVHCTEAHPVELAMMRRLEARGLVQGKRGRPYMAVHTRDGLELVRALRAKQEPGQ